MTIMSFRAAGAVSTRGRDLPLAPLRSDVLDGDLVDNCGVTGRGAFSFTGEISLCHFLSVPDHAGDDRSQIEAAVETVFAQAVDTEKSITGREKIHRPRKRLLDPFLIVRHVDDYLRDLGELRGDKTRVDPLLISFCSRGVLSAVPGILHIPPK